jgi:hypothetical protein
MIDAAPGIPAPYSEGPSSSTSRPSQSEFSQSGDVDLGVNSSGVRVSMSQEFANFTELGSALEHLSGQRVEVMPHAA